MSFKWRHPWGRLPDDARAYLQHYEWDNNRNLRARLTRERDFPIEIPLKPPTGKQALTDIVHFHAWMQAWGDVLLPDGVDISWELRQYRELAAQHTPVNVRLRSMQALIAWLGPAAIARSQCWEQRMRPILDYDQSLYPVLVKHLTALENMAQPEADLIAQALPQFRPGMGNGDYLRALPLVGVDTKFVETHQTLLGDLLDVLHTGAISNSGGLCHWLNCRQKPDNWLWIRPLCPLTRSALAGLPLLRLDAETLRTHPLPGKRILVVENLESGYALPPLAGTVAVFGGGKNIAWMDADWLHDRQIAYWGDIDSWGLQILADARRLQPHLQALLMDEATLRKHQHHMTHESSPCESLPENLTIVEQQVFQRLRDRAYGNTRLEQERLAADYVASSLGAWAESVSHDDA